MTSIRAIVALACVLAVSACGGVARSGGAPTEPSSGVAVTETSMESLQPVDSPAELEATTEVAVPSGPEPDRATTSTTAAAGPGPTTTIPAETIDLGSVQAAQFDLDDLFAAFESRIGSIDLEEGETP